MTNLAPMLRAMQVAGIDSAPLRQPDIAHLVAFGHQLISHRNAPGVELAAEEQDDQIRVHLTVRRGCRIERPVHLCLGLFEPVGAQKIVMTVMLEEESDATFLAHCLFTQARSASHHMQAEIRLAEEATLHYMETHFHGQSGGIDVRPQAHIVLARGARLWSDFSLTRGRVGQLDIDYLVDVGENAIAEFSSKVYGRADDHIRIKECLRLNGPQARGLIKSRIAAADDAVAEIIGITEGNAAGARGHVDCLEIVRDRAIVSANPQVKVSHPQAKVTHEAAIGSVDHQQLETLMARGLAPDSAVDLIVSGLLQ